jgi:hypothetical protein
MENPTLSNTSVHDGVDNVMMFDNAPQITMLETNLRVISAVL